VGFNSRFKPRYNYIEKGGNLMGADGVDGVRCISKAIWGKKIEKIRLSNKNNIYMLI
jgi:hypothetical protein